MPITPTYPGVYVEEIPSGVRTITGVATSITAFIGRALKGPVDEPITINNFGDFERIFGGLWVESTLGYAVQDFFLNGGGQAIVVRLYAPEAPSPSEDTDASSEESPAEETEVSSGSTPSPEDSIESEATGDADTVTGEAEGGEDAEIEESPDSASTPPEVPGEIAAQPVSGPTAEVAGEAEGGEDAEIEESSDSTPTSASEVPGETAAQPVSSPTAEEDNNEGTHSAGSNASSEDGTARLNAQGLLLMASSPGAWGNHLRVRITHDTPEEVAKRYNLEKSDFFNLTIRDTHPQSGVTEEFRNLTIRDSPRSIHKVLENESDLIRFDSNSPNTGSVPTPHTNPGTNKSIWEDDGASSTVHQKGGDGAHLKGTDYIGSGKESAKKGLYALRKADLFNLLCLPPFPYDNYEQEFKNLVESAAKLCQDSRAFLIVDPPKNWNSKGDAKSGIENLGPRSNHAAVFFPMLIKPNILRENQPEPFAPCGAVAGIFARTDAQRGVWKAPAGLEARLVGVNKLSVPLTDAENGELNPLGINCLRTLPPAGHIVWGARTLEGDDRLASEWKYIPVRRLALFIEESLYRSLKWVVFEPNDEPLWAQIRLNVGSFMHDLFRQGAFQGQTPRAAYLVKCDSETTTQSDINRGIVNIVVGFAPLKPAEFVFVKIQQLAGQLAT